MKRQIKIRVGSVAALADLSDTKTAEAIWQTLPFSSTVNTWGDEIYFSIPLKIGLESGQEIVNLGLYEKSRLEKMEQLKERDGLSEEQYYFLLSRQYARPELSDITMGNDEAFTDGTPQQILP